MSTIKNYFSLIKFSHTIFAMPFAMIGFFLAVKLFRGSAAGSIDYQLAFQQDVSRPLWLLFFLVLCCMILARSAAMAFNRYLDRHFDARNPRTALREIPAGIISADRALYFTLLSSFGFIICSYFINPLCFILSPVALAVILGYSYTKRFTALCHLVLGLGLSLAPIGAYLAVTGRFNIVPILFSLSVIFWVSGFDIIYALQDEDFDRQQGLHSIPASLGKERALKVSSLLHVASTACVIAAGYLGGFGWLYVCGLAVFIGMLIYQHSIVKPNDLSRVNLAFMTANGIASVVFAIFAIADMFFL